MDAPQRVYIASKPYGYEQVSSQDAAEGHIDRAIAIASAEVANATRGYSVVGSSFKFQYIGVRPFAKTHYVIVFVSDSAKYGTHLLGKIRCSEPNTPYPFIKDAYVAPWVNIEQLENYGNQFVGSPANLPCLVVEVWTTTEIQLKSIVRVDGSSLGSGGAGAGPESDQWCTALRKDCVRISNATNPERTMHMPPVVARVIDPEAIDDASLNMPIPPAVMRHEAALAQVKHIYKLLYLLHADSNESPIEYHIRQLDEKDETRWQVHAVGFRNAVTLEDMMSVYFYSMKSIRSVYYDCSIASGVLPRNLCRGALVVNFDLQPKYAPLSARERAKECISAGLGVLISLPKGIDFDVPMAAAAPAPPPSSATVGMPKAKVLLSTKRPAPGVEEGEGSLKRVRPSDEARQAAVVEAKSSGVEPCDAPLQMTRPGLWVRITGKFRRGVGAHQGGVGGAVEPQKPVSGAV